MNTDLPIKIQLPDGFFEEELRNDYLVSKEMKEIWAVELDLLKAFQEVCEKHHLIYYADGGTMLGAIRHGGYIPWDDDIDLLMPREDYEKLCEVAESEFQFPYFFQTEYTDPTSLRGHAQLRNSKTTAILLYEYEGINNFNQGIFIDIFPLDSVPDDEELLKKKVEQTEYNLTKARYLANIGTIYTPSPKNKPIRGFIKKLRYKLFSGYLKNMIDFDKYYRKYEEACKLYNDSNSKKIGLFFRVPFCNERTWNREDFAETTDFKFEMLTLPIPVGYERIMTIYYGPTWRIPTKAPSLHSEVLFDTRKSYLEYLKEKRK